MTQKRPKNQNPKKVWDSCTELMVVLPHAVLFWYSVLLCFFVVIPASSCFFSSLFHEENCATPPAWRRPLRVLKIAKLQQIWGSNHKTAKTLMTWQGYQFGTCYCNCSSMECVYCFHRFYIETGDIASCRRLKKNDRGLQMYNLSKRITAGKL